MLLPCLQVPAAEFFRQFYAEVLVQRPGFARLRRGDASGSVHVEPGVRNRSLIIQLRTQNGAV